MTDSAGTMDWLADKLKRDEVHSGRPLACGEVMTRTSVNLTIAQYEWLRGHAQGASATMRRLVGEAMRADTTH